MEDKMDLDIIDFIEKEFSMKIVDSKSINRGLLNLKWKITTNQGRLFVKKYHPLRYNKNKLKNVKIALFYQNKLNQLGIKCPKLFACNDKYLFKTKQGNYFILTEYSTGNLINSGKININQAYSLGIEMAKMHYYTNNLELKYENVGWKIPKKENLLEKWENNWNKLQTSNQKIIEVLKKQKEIFEKCDLSRFEQLQPTLAHNDLWCDNILYHKKSVSSILDFDRFHLTYTALDIARAILSFGLDQFGLRKDVVLTFMKGYNVVKQLSRKDVILSIQLCFIRESLSWLGTDIKINNGPPERFKDEMIWIAYNWEQLERVIW